MKAAARKRQPASDRAIHPNTTKKKGRSMPSSQTSERENERLRTERDEVAAAAKRLSACLQQFIDDAADPGTEALAAQYEMSRILSLMSIGEDVIGEAQYLSRFSVTPSEVHRFLAARLAEDVHLRYQQAIGNQAVEEAAKDMRGAIAVRSLDPTRQPLSAKEAADYADPMKGGGPFPSALIRFGETGSAS